MQGDVEDGVVGGEDVLRSVAVMDVEVDDRDAADSALQLHVACRDGDVVHQAEAHRTARRGMVARRPHERKGAGLRRLDRTTGREQAGLPARLGRDRVGVVEPGRLVQLLQDL